MLTSRPSPASRQDADKAPGEVLSSGSVVRRGEGNGVVILTGAKTYFGRTTELVQEARPKLHIEAVVAKVVRWLFVIVGALLGVVIVLSLIRGAPLLEMVPLMLVLLMSAVPVALPVMFTVSMAVGAKELAKRGVLVTRLSAAEDAATMDVLCVDKTGTITMNQLAVTGVIPLEHATESDVLFVGALASQEANQDPIDLAFLAAAKERHIFDDLPKVTPVSFTPFDAKNRRTEAVVEQNGQRLRVMKGAVRTVAEACGLQPPAIEALEARVSESALKGYRTLAVARGPETGAPLLVGLVTLYDPPRPDAKQLIAALHDLGVPVKMLTGDALAVASEIAHGVGLPNIRRVADLKAAGAQAGNEAVYLLADADGFAEVYPEDKYIVVQHLQAAGHVTGMTGDGVNDAPALRQAEVGIAVSTATDIAKGAASVVLTEPGLTNIVSLGRAGADHLPTHPDVDHQQDQPDDPEGGLRGHRVRGDRQVRRLRLCDAAAGLHDGLREDRPCHRPCSTVQETGDVEHRGLHYRVRCAGRYDGRGGAPPLVDRLVAFRSGDQQQWPLHLQLPDAALLCRVLHRVRAGAPLVLDDDAQQDPRGGPHGGYVHRHRPDVRRPPGTHAIALVADARDFRLCDGLVPCRERRREGRDDQMAHSRSSGIKRF